MTTFITAFIIVATIYVVAYLIEGVYLQSLRDKFNKDND